MKFVILHGYSDSNKGDLAIVVASIQALKTLYPYSQIVLQTVFSRDDPDYEFHHRFVTQLGITIDPMSIPSPYSDNECHSALRNLRAFFNLGRNAALQGLIRYFPFLRTYLPDAAKPLDHLRNSDVVFLKGGQYIYNDQGGLRGLLYLWRILNPIHVAYSFGTPIIMLGQSVGPIVGTRARVMTRAALAKCHSLIVREDLSASLMLDFQLGKKTVMAPDMAFLIKPRPPRQRSAEAQRLEHGRWLGVTVVNWNYPDSSDVKASRASYEHAIVGACCRIHQETGLSIALFPQVTVRHHGESDTDLIAKVEKRLIDKAIDVISIQDDLWPDEFSYLYGRCQALLGTRLHSCILAACAKTPVVAIRYQGFKTEGVMQGLGLVDFVHDINNVNSNALVTSIKRTLEKRESLSAIVGQRIEEYQNQLMDVIKHQIEQAVTLKTVVNGTDGINGKI